MVIQTGGTTRLGNNGELQNIASLDATTTATIGAAAGGGSITATASGAISAGDPIVLNTDGTVSSVSGSYVNEDIGDPVDIFTGSSQRSLAIINDPANNKVVSFYKNAAAYGVAKVGTVSGTSISYGSEVSFANENVQEAYASYDETASKIVIIWRAATPYYLKARVGTVSGTSISFGSTYTLNADESTNLGIAYIGSGKHIVSYGDNFTDTRAHVITVSGTAISSGSQVQLSTAYPGRAIAVGWDTNTSRALIISSDAGTSGKAWVASVSGTTITSGSANAFSSSAVQYAGIVYNPDISRLIVSFGDASYGNFGRMMTATISGLTVTFGPIFTWADYSVTSGGMLGLTYDTAANRAVVTIQDPSLSNAGTYRLIEFTGTDPTSTTAPAIFETGSTGYPWVTYDDHNSKVVTSYRDAGDANKIKAAVIQPPYANSNMTSTNFLGFSDGAYSNAATATIDIVGGVNTNQSGLTIGQRYYVEVDGTLQLAPSAFAPDALGGLATAATKLIVKG